jgi:hypothetical protein
VKIETSEQLQRVLDAVSDDLVQANCYYKLFRDINDSIAEYVREMNQSRVFWSLTRYALLDAAILRLCRVYERNTDKKANSLGNLLAAIKRNLHIFEFEPFRERTKANVHLDPFKSWTKLNEDQLEADINFATESNAAVKKLVFWRDKWFVHRDSTIVIRKIDVEQIKLPTYDDYDSLLDNGMTIVNRYSSLFHRHTHGRTLIGNDDYTYVLKSIRNNLEANREKLKAEFRNYGIDYDGE